MESAVGDGAPGGCAPQSSSISRSADTTSLAEVRSKTSSVRTLGPPERERTIPAGRPRAVPRIRNSTPLDATASVVGSAEPQRRYLSAVRRRCSLAACSGVGLDEEERLDAMSRPGRDPDRLRVRRLSDRRADRPGRDAGRRLPRPRPAAETRSGRAEADVAGARAGSALPRPLLTRGGAAPCRSSTRTSSRSTTQVTSTDASISRCASSPGTDLAQRSCGARVHWIRPARWRSVARLRTRSTRRTRKASSTAT